jgi:hypothetical protein
MTYLKKSQVGRDDMREVNPFTGKSEVKETSRNKEEFLRSCFWSLSEEDRQVVYESIDNMWWAHSDIVARMKRSFGAPRDWLLFLTLIAAPVTGVILSHLNVPWHGTAVIVTVQLIISFVATASLGTWILDTYILGKRVTEKKPSKIKQFFTLLGGN